MSGDLDSRIVARGRGERGIGDEGVDHDEREGVMVSLVFFFQAEDGIRDLTVTGVQTCALPISPLPSWPTRAGTRFGAGVSWSSVTSRSSPSCVALRAGSSAAARLARPISAAREIGRASCRERV